MATTARRRSLIGEKIGNYALVSVLGEGGMGVVYLAEHAVIGKRAAIKVLHADHAARAEAAARCFVEARAVHAIAHPNVVDVIDCGVAELGEGAGSVHYLVMEHLEGRSLREVLRDEAEGAGRGLPVARALAIAAEAGSALAAAHKKGIVHRDIKPENLFLVGGGAGAAPIKLKVLDFGIAKLMDGHPFGGPLTQSGVALGTPTYMAPEQLDGEDIDGRVDVYALGIVLFEMLTGAAPFADEPTARGVWRRMNEVPALPEGLALPGAVEDLLLRALDPDRVRRPSMVELVRGLVDPEAASAVAEEPHTRRVAKPKQPVREARPVEAKPSQPRQPRWMLVGGLGLVAGVAAALAVPKLMRDERPPAVAPASEPTPVPVEPSRVVEPSQPAAPPPATAPEAAALALPASPPPPSTKLAPPRPPPAKTAPSKAALPEARPTLEPAPAASVTVDAGVPAAPEPPSHAPPAGAAGRGDNLLPPRR